MRHCTDRIFVIAFALQLAAAAHGYAQSRPGPIVPYVRPIEISVSAPDTSKQEPAVELRFSPNTCMPNGDVWQDKRVYTTAELALLSSEYVDGRYVENSQHPDDPGLWELLRVGYGDQFHRLWSDTKNFYGTENLLCVGLVVAAAAPLANTHADQEIRNWYQAQAGRGQSSAADHFADVGKQFGEYKYTIPAFLVMSLGSHLFPDQTWMAPIGNFGDRSLRALAIGAPMVGILQVGLGGQSPYANDSYWHPFQYAGGVSSQAFVGAVPFLTAASMTESRALKAVLFAGSMWAGWSRVHNDDNYFSQVLIGWSIAYLATQAVNQTEGDTIRIVPIALPNGMGMGVHLQY